MAIIESITADEIFALDVTGRKELYRALRDEMEDEYQEVSPRAASKRRDYIARRREAAAASAIADSHRRHADTEERKLEQKEDRYYGTGEQPGLQEIKYALAILTGRYDTRMPTIYADKDSLEQRAARQRLRETGRPVVEHEVVIEGGKAHTRPVTA